MTVFAEMCVSWKGPFLGFCQGNREKSVQNDSWSGGSWQVADKAERFSGPCRDALSFYRKSGGYNKEFIVINLYRNGRYARTSIVFGGFSVLMVIRKWLFEREGKGRENAPFFRKNSTLTLKSDCYLFLFPLRRLCVHIFCSLVGQGAGQSCPVGDVLKLRILSICLFTAG